MNQFNVLNERLGRGSYGTAKLVERKTDKKKFVVKEVRGIKSPEEAENNEEVRILKSMKNPNIVRWIITFFKTCIT